MVGVVTRYIVRSTLRVCNWDVQAAVAELMCIHQAVSGQWPDTQTALIYAASVKLEAAMQGPFLTPGAFGEPDF